MVVKSTRAIKEGKQWLLNYDPHHQCGERAARKGPGAGGTGGQEKREKGDEGAATPEGNDR